MTTCYWPIVKLNHRPMSLPWQLPLNHLWQSLQARLWGGVEPRVWSVCPTTPTLWNGYDPVTGEVIHQVTETDLRIWLEERHYRDQAIARQRQAQLRYYWNA